MTVPERLARNYGALVSLNKLSDLVRTHLLPALSADTILALVDCVKNVIIRNVPLTESQIEKLRKHRKSLEEIVRIPRHRGLDASNYSRKVAGSSPPSSVRFFRS